MYIDINGKLFCGAVPASGNLEEIKELVEAIETDNPRIKGKVLLWMRKVNDPRKHESYLDVHCSTDNEWTPRKSYKVFLNLPESIILATTPVYKVIRKDKDGNIVTRESVTQKYLKEAIERGYKLSAFIPGAHEEDICTIENGWETVKYDSFPYYFRTMEELEKRIPENERHKYVITQIA